jgi:NADPH-dependent glutamate synthase beta subunit-like oxidoreductase
MALKRFVADWVQDHPWADGGWQPGEAGRTSPVVPRPLSGKRVAIVGAGPAGLTCAQDLNRQGCAVTVFEALPVPGGMMRVGVPAYRLPHEIVQREIEAIIAQGIELKLNHRVEDVEALRAEYDAAFVAIGAHGGVKLPIPGNDLPETLLATEFLREAGLRSSISSYQSPIANRRVLVLGGGNVAVDAAMTAVRLGAAWVGMTCLESRAQMPAHEWEVKDAEEEGIEVFPSRTFKEVTSEAGRVTGVRAVKVDFRAPTSPSSPPPRKSSPPTW